jgi:hypothetical protein
VASGLAAADDAFVPKSVIFSSADASDVPWGVREYDTAIDGLSSPLLRDAAALFEVVDGGNIVWKWYAFD